MFKQLLTGGSVLALLLVGGFSAQAKPQASVLQAQIQEAPLPDTQTAPPAGTIEPGTSPEGTTTPGVTPDAGTPETTSPDATTSPDSGVTPPPDSQTSTSDSKTERAAIFCESHPINSPTGGGSRQFRECQQ